MSEPDVAAIRASWAKARKRNRPQRWMHEVWLAWHRWVLRHGQGRCGFSTPVGSRTHWMPRVCDCEITVTS